MCTNIYTYTYEKFFLPLKVTKQLQKKCMYILENLEYMKKIKFNKII